MVFTSDHRDVTCSVRAMEMLCHKPFIDYQGCWDKALAAGSHQDTECVKFKPVFDGCIEKHFNAYR